MCFRHDRVRRILRYLGHIRWHATFLRVRFEDAVRLHHLMQVDEEKVPLRKLELVATPEELDLVADAVPILEVDAQAGEIVVHLVLPADRQPCTQEAGRPREWSPVMPGELVPLDGHDLNQVSPC